MCVRVLVSEVSEGAVSGVAAQRAGRAEQGSRWGQREGTGQRSHAGVRR